MTSSGKSGTSSVDDPYKQLNELISQMIARNMNRRIGCVGLKKGDTETTVAFGRGPEWSKKVRELFQTWYATELQNSMVPEEFEFHIRSHEQLHALLDSLSYDQARYVVNYLLEHQCKDFAMSVPSDPPMPELSSLVRPLGETKKDSALPSSVEVDSSSTNASPESESTESNAT